MIRYLSLCSGIEAFSCAVHDMPEFVPVAFAEIEPFPCKVLAHHYPDVPNLGDITKINGADYRGAVDLIVGGTPCQDFSVAGTRKGLAGERSGLAMHFVRIVGECRPRWVLWENVPGCTSTPSHNPGGDFAAFLTALYELGYCIAYRILDARFFGVPQRRRRVFLVGHLGNWRSAAEVLFECQSLCGNPEPRRETWKEIAKCLTRGLGTRLDAETDTFAISSIGQYTQTDIACTLRAAGGDAGGGSENLVKYRQGIRRLTPIESERLMGFTDNYTLIPGASDTARYKALGNSMAVPCMRWIAQRMAKVDKRIS